MSNEQDLYTIIGVSPNALDEDIRRAFRQASMRLHPDVNKNPGAINQYRDISAAYQILGDAQARQKYDQKYHTRPETPDYFSLRVTPSKRVLTKMDEPQVLYLLVEIIPDRTIERSKLVSPVNVCLVVDRSTSMNGVRLERTKYAAHQIIDQLGEHDVVSVVTFSDRAEVLIKAAPLADKNAAKVMVTTLTANGGTEIYQGLQTGYDEIKRYLGRNYVNHMVLITDGRTYGDEEECLNLAEQAAQDGIGISAMGFGEEWNDSFLDRIASRTGGYTEYIRSPSAVVRFLNERIRSLGDALAERLTLSLAPDPDIVVESAFRLIPTPQPVTVDADPLQLGQLQPKMNTSVLVQLQMPALRHQGFRSLMRIVASGDIMWENHTLHQVVTDTSIEVRENPADEDPPLAILDALGKLTLYRMQQKAVESIQKGDVREATRKLENLATRLLAAGQEDLANAAMAEARRVSQTHALSDEGQKNLKYGTKMLLLAASQDRRDSGR